MAIIMIVISISIIIVYLSFPSVAYSARKGIERALVQHVGEFMYRLVSLSLSLSLSLDTASESPGRPG